MPDKARCYVGLSKGSHHSSVCILKQKGANLSAEIVLRERFEQKKYAGLLSHEMLDEVLKRVDVKKSFFAENQPGERPEQSEDRLAEKNPFFYDRLRLKGYQPFFKRLNPSLTFVPHHFCHAMAATAVSPFSKALVVVLDGHGNNGDAIPHSWKKREWTASPPPQIAKGRATCESGSVYVMNKGRLKCVEKIWQIWSPKTNLALQGDGIGMFYHNVAKYIFNSGFHAGKVMGLAPFGTSQHLENHRSLFLEGLDRGKAFHGTCKKEWEASGRFQFFADIAATAQSEFEIYYEKLLERLAQTFPDYRNLIVTGGCALNCVANMKILKKGWFDDVYVPSFPGDECIGFGAAASLVFDKNPKSWKIVPYEKQDAFLGPVASIPEETDILELFRDFKIEKPKSLARRVARLISEGRILGLFQGRSEVGPRALGHRSILASPMIRGMKDRLNREVKSREDFRPYGVSCLWQATQDYFFVPRGMESPFMSFAPFVRPAYREKLAEVIHVDGTSRIQTVRKSQNPLFYDLLFEFRKLTGVGCLLNTSLNVMGQPIVEELRDCRRLLQTVPLDGLIVKDFLISRN